jgi:hypothetical protein
VAFVGAKPSSIVGIPGSGAVVFATGKNEISLFVILDENDWALMTLQHNWALQRENKVRMRGNWN